jgi:putative sterol carrier protein
MTYEKIFADIKKIYSKADKNKLDGDFAFQFNISGEGEGSFYVAYRGGILEVAPYDYVDRCALLTASGENLIKLASAKFSLEDAVANGSVEVQGDYNLALELNKLASGAPVPKEPAKRAKKEPAAKKPAAPKKEKLAAPAKAKSAVPPASLQEINAASAVKIIPGDETLV